MNKREMPITIFEMNIDTSLPLSKEQQMELEALAAKPDSGIDYSDIPPVDGLERFYRPVRK